MTRFEVEIVCVLGQSPRARNLERAYRAWGTRSLFVEPQSRGGERIPRLDCAVSAH
jgi:hypothetical protein